MNIFERALTPETYTNALEDPGSAIKNVVSDPAFGLVAGTMLGMPQFGGFSAMQAALMTGGISALATGSLQKGFMTGLSAYGGAGLSDSFMKAGASDLATKNVAEFVCAAFSKDLIKAFTNRLLAFAEVARAQWCLVVSATSESTKSSDFYAKNR